MSVLLGGNAPGCCCRPLTLGPLKGAVLCQKSLALANVEVRFYAAFLGSKITKIEVIILFNCCWLVFDRGVSKYFE
jgi:hypothetical protein